MDDAAQRELLRLIYVSIRELNTLTNLLDVALNASHHAGTNAAVEASFGNVIAVYNTLVEARNVLCESLDTSSEHDSHDDGHSHVSSVAAVTAIDDQPAATTGDEFVEPDAEPEVRAP